MEKAEIINTVITGITYLAPLCAIVWRVAKADGKITSSEKKIMDIQKECEQYIKQSEKLSLVEQKLNNLETNLIAEKNRSDRMERSLGEIKENLKGVSTKLDMLLDFKKKGI